MLKQEWIVQLTVTSTHEYSIDAVSEEDAISQAEALYEDGEPGDILNFEIEAADGFATHPTDDEEYDEDGSGAEYGTDEAQGLNFDRPYRGSYE